jgi:hypothetical protein
MIDKGASQGSTRQPHGMRTMTADTQIMTHISKNGNGCVTQFVMYGSLFGHYLPGKNKDSVSTARRFREAKSFNELITDPGGTQRIQALR